MALTGYEPRRQPISKDIRDPRFRLKLLFVIAALPAAAIALLAPKAIALPSIALASLSLAALCALYAWRNRLNYRSQGLTFWDLAGMLVLIGAGASAMTEPAAALELFGLSATTK